MSLRVRELDVARRQRDAGVDRARKNKPACSHWEARGHWNAQNIPPAMSFLAEVNSSEAAEAEGVEALEGGSERENDEPCEK